MISGGLLSPKITPSIVSIKNNDIRATNNNVFFSASVKMRNASKIIIIMTIPKKMIPRFLLVLCIFVSRLLFVFIVLHFSISSNISWATLLLLSNLSLNVLMSYFKFNQPLSLTIYIILYSNLVIVFSHGNFRNKKNLQHSLLSWSKSVYCRHKKMTSMVA